MSAGPPGEHGEAFVLIGVPNDDQRVVMLREGILPRPSVRCSEDHTDAIAHISQARHSEAKAHITVCVDYMRSTKIDYALWTQEHIPAMLKAGADTIFVPLDQANRHLRGWGDRVIGRCNPLWLLAEITSFYNNRGNFLCSDSMFLKFESQK